jgi:hypothetical protein
MPLAAPCQVAGYRQMDRATRSQFGNSLAFGVREMIDARFALLDETLNAGADPSRWANNHPGRHIAEVTGTPSDQWALTHRTFKISEEETVSTLELSRNAGFAKCDEGTFNLLSKGIERPQKMIVSVPDWKSVDTTPTLDLPVLAEPEPVRSFEMIKGGATPSAAPVDDADDDKQTMIDDRISELEASGVTELTKDDFDDLPFEMSRTWIFKALGRQVKIGRLRRLPGKGARYEIISAAQREEG